MVQAAMTAAKQNNQLANILKLCTTLAEKRGADSDSGSDDDSDDDGFTLDPETLAKVKKSAYEKLAKDKGKTVEELKAEAKEMSVSITPPVLRRPAKASTVTSSLSRFFGPCGWWAHAGGGKGGNVCRAAEASKQGCESGTHQAHGWDGARCGEGVRCYQCSLDLRQPR